MTGADGLVTFTTIMPGWYSGRTIHIQVRARLNGVSFKVTHLFFNETVNGAVLATAAYARSRSRDTTNAADGIYQQEVAVGNALVVPPTGSTPPPGLVADFLAQAVQPPVRPAPVRRVGPWAESVADAVRAAGVEVTTAYPVGRNEVDVCAGSGLQSLGVVCEVHPDGPDAHIDRNLALREAGWDVVEAHPSRWESRLQELVVDLTLRLRGRG